jgi:hypothetical protein
MIKQRIVDIWSKTTAILRTRGRWVGYALTVLAVVYLGGILLYGGFKIPAIDWHAYLLASLTTLGLYLISLLPQFFVWMRLFSFHHQVGWRDLEIYSRMILVRRLPGGIWHWFGRATLYTATTSVRTEVVLLGNLMEWGMLILLGGSISAIELIKAPISVRVLLPVLLVGGAIALAVIWQPRMRALWLRLSEAALWVFLYGVAWLIGGIILYLVARATGENQLNLATAVGVWSLAGSVSMIITILPVIGVQEVSLVFLLQPYLPASSALLVALLLRLLFTLSDVLWGLTGWGIASLALRKRNLPLDPMH